MYIITTILLVTYILISNRDEYYQDRIHFEGPLSIATVQQVLNRICPHHLGTRISLGDDLPDETELINKKIIFARYNNSDNSTTTTMTNDQQFSDFELAAVTNAAGIMFRIAPRSSCSSHFNLSHQIFILPESTFKDMHVSPWVSHFNSQFSFENPLFDALFCTFERKS